MHTKAMQACVPYPALDGIAFRWLEKEDSFYELPQRSSKDRKLRLDDYEEA